MSSTAWYVAVDDTTRGPAPTELVIKGIEHRKVPPEAMVCAAGSGRWMPLASVPAFHTAVVRSYPPPPPHSAEARQWLEQGFHFPPPAPLPRFDDGIAMEWRSGLGGGHPHTPGLGGGHPHTPGPRVSAYSIPEIDVELDTDADEPLPIDWTEPFESYFLVGEEVALPDERSLLASLATATRETFRREDSLWNLALCLAYGSEEVAAAAARAFFEAVGDQGGGEQVEWMRRTLRSDGFMPSGIPEDASRRAYHRLRSSCPPALSAKLS